MKIKMGAKSRMKDEAKNTHPPKWPTQMALSFSKVERREDLINYEV